VEGEWLPSPTPVGVTERPPMREVQSAPHRGSATYLDGPASR
jgi:hypothetical protein